MSEFVNNIASFKCGGTAVLPYRIVFLTGSMLVSTAFETSLSIGVSTEVGGDPLQTMDVVIAGIAYLQIANIGLNPGALLGCDANGRGAALVAGNRAVGILLETPTAIDQICKILVVQSA